MKKVLLQGRDICKSFSPNGENSWVLNNVHVKIYEHDFTVIMGPSGAGKSTLLYSLSGMERIENGEVFYKDEKISGLSEKQMAHLRAREFGFVFQQTHLVSNLTLYENIAVAGFVSQKNPPEIVEKTAKALLEHMHISNAKDRLPAQVSGGEAQRAAIARAIINAPGLVFADEPTGALNRSNSETVLNLLSEMNQAGQSILMVTHDVRAALRGNRILYLEDGRLLAEMELSMYDAYDAKNRERKVTDWLSSLAW